jgi:NTP pyrophosphatase (non-canonical NTP hydrolase)
MVMQEALSFSAFANKIDDLYGAVNKGRDFEYMYSYLCRNSSYLSRSILRDGDSKLFFAKAFSWIFSVAGKMEVDLGTAFRKKFPGVCPYCLGLPCQCNETHRAPINNLPAYAVRGELNDKYNTDINASKELTLEKAIVRIGSIYPANKAIWKAFGSFYHFSRLFEELGEVHEAYSSYKKTGEKLNFEEELADATAWLLSAWGIYYKEESLSDWLMDYYMDGCPVCKKPACACKEYSDRPQMISDKASLEEVKLRIVELIGLDPALKDEINELLQSMDQAIATTSTVDAKQAVGSVKRTLGKLFDAIKTAGDVTDNASKVASNIQTILARIDDLKSFWPG